MVESLPSRLKDWLDNCVVLGLMQHHLLLRKVIQGIVVVLTFDFCEAYVDSILVNIELRAIHLFVLFDDVSSLNLELRPPYSV